MEHAELDVLLGVKPDLDIATSGLTEKAPCLIGKFFNA